MLLQTDSRIIKVFLSLLYKNSLEQYFFKLLLLLRKITVFTHSILVFIQSVKFKKSCSEKYSSKVVT